MPGVTITLRDEELQRKLSALANGLQNTRPLMKRWGEIAHASVQRNFEVGGRPMWQPLSASTIRSRISGRKTLKKLAHANLSDKRRNRSPFRITFVKPLVVTGSLSRVRIKVIGDQEVKIGTAPEASKYAAIQNFGGRAGRGRKVLIPARTFMLLQEEDRAEMQEAAIDYVKSLGK